MTSPLLVVTGLRREAALLQAPGLVVIPGGGDSTGLATKLEAALRQHAPRGVASVGLGGALSPALAVGDWVVADHIVAGGETWAAHPTWAAELFARLCSPMAVKAHLGVIAAGDAMVVDAAAKAALRTATGAIAVDMESHVAARVAAAHGLPFATLRTISDGADRALPKAAQAGMKKDGGMDILAVLKSLALDPAQLPALIRTGREAEIAFRALGLLRRYDLLGRLGVGDLDLGQLLLDVV
jgi:adenosylhomocysteine nucleosidase